MSSSDDVFAYGGRKAPPPQQGHSRPAAGSTRAPCVTTEADPPARPVGRPRKRARRNGQTAVLLVDDSDDEDVVVVQPEPAAPAAGEDDAWVRVRGSFSPKAPAHVAHSCCLRRLQKGRLPRSYRSNSWPCCGTTSRRWRHCRDPQKLKPKSMPPLPRWGRLSCSICSTQRGGKRSESRRLRRCFCSPLYTLPLTRSQFAAIFDAFCEKTGQARASLRVTFDGDLVDEEETPGGLGCEGEEVLDVAT